MDFNIDPCTTNYTPKCVAKREHQGLERNLLRFLEEDEVPGFIDGIVRRIAAELDAELEDLRRHSDLNTRLRIVDYELEFMQRVNHEIRATLERLPLIEDAFRDQPGCSMLQFRRWFIRAELGLDCTGAALAAMTGLMIPVGQQMKPAFKTDELKPIPDLVLSLRPYMMDYLNYPGLSHYELANIARAQLGLLTINGSVPPAWRGLSFPDMVRAYLGLISVPALQPAFAKTMSSHVLAGAGAHSSSPQLTNIARS